MKETSAKARTPRQKRGIETRARILQAARELFSQKGFHGTNSKEIAAAAGVSIGSFYSYFDEKGPLFLEVLRDYSAEVTEKLMDFQKQGIDFQQIDTRTAVYLFLQNLLQAHDLSPDFHREAETMRYGDPEVQKVFQQEEEKVVKALLGFFTLFQDRIRVTDWEAAALVIREAAEGVILSIKIFESPMEPERRLNALADMVHRYLFE
jgi:AcrR family transcriptional regulator